MVVLAVVLLCGCGRNTAKHEDDKTVIDTVYIATGDEMEAWKKIKGIGPFVIGQTTFSQACKEKSVRSLKFFYSYSPNTLYNGHWGNKFWHNPVPDKKLLGLKDWAKCEWMEKNSKGLIKQIHAAQSIDPIMLGEYKFGTFDLAFLNEKLVAIWLYPSDDTKYNFFKAYFEKYGEGNGRYHKEEYKSPSLKPEEATMWWIIVDEHTWSNGSVTVEYYNKESFHVSPGTAPSYNHEMRFIIYDSVKLPEFESALKQLAADYDTMMLDKIKSSADIL